MAEPLLQSLDCFSAATKKLIDEAQSPQTDSRDVRGRIERRICELQDRVEDRAVVRAHASDEIRSLKSAYNNVAPVARLPTEVLTNILLLHKREYPIFGSRSNHWLYITHICRHWRQITLECAEFWTAIDCTKNLRMAETMFRRSKTAPVSTTFVAEPHTMGSHFSLFRRCLRRLASVDLRCPVASDEFDIASILSHFPSNRPNLEKVFVSSPLEPKDPGIPKTFLAGVNPSLRTLEIAGRILWKGIPNAPLLTNLTLLNSPSEPISRPLVAEFLQSLCNLPQLQKLHLSRFLPHVTHDRVSDAHSSLPQLRSLTLEDDLVLITSFLNACTIGAAPHISLHIGTKDLRAVSVDAILPLFSAIRRIWGHPGDTEARRELQKIELYRWNGDNITTLKRVRLLFQGQGSSDHELDVWFASSLNRGEDMDNLLIAVTATFQLNHQLSLVLDHCCPTVTSAIELWSNPKIASTLTKIEFRQCVIGGFVSALEHALSQDPSSLGNPFPFPELSRIVVSGYGGTRIRGRNQDLQDHWMAVLSLADLMAKRVGPDVTAELLVTNASMREDTYEKLHAFNKPSLNLILKNITRTA